MRLIGCYRPSEHLGHFIFRRSMSSEQLAEILTKVLHKPVILFAPATAPIPFGGLRSWEYFLESLLELIALSVELDDFTCSFLPLLRLSLEILRGIITPYFQIAQKSPPITPNTSIPLITPAGVEVNHQSFRLCLSTCGEVGYSLSSSLKA